MNTFDETSELVKLQQWQQQGKGVALATVIQTWGSCPRPVGSHLAICKDGSFAGSVSGGCIESAVISEAQDVIKSGTARLLDFDVADEQAWQVGLTCGGKIQLYLCCIDPELLSGLLDNQANKCTVAMVTCLDNANTWLVYDDTVSGKPGLSQADIAQARSLLGEARSGLLDSGGRDYFVRSYMPDYRLIIIGAVHVAQVLAPMATLTGFHVTIIDPRRAFTTDERFPNSALMTDWPDEALEALALDKQTAVVTLSHDPKIDDPALHVALNSPAFYIGCLGSRRTHGKRLERLEATGLGHLVERIHAPAGIDLGRRAQSPAEIAVSILAQVVAAKSAKPHSTS